MKRNQKGYGTRRVTDSSRVTTANERDLRIIRLHVDHLRRTGATEQTLHHRRENLRRLAERMPDLLQATPESIDEWQSAAMHRVSLSSVATYTSHTCAFYAWAVEAGHLEVNPAARLPKPRVPKRHPRPIPAADLDMALACAPDPIYAWLVLGAYMGLRAGEIAAIRREDITEGIIDGQRRWFLSGTGKGRKPYRLPIPVDVVPVLVRHMRGISGPLWRNRAGTGVTRPQLTCTVSAFFHRLELPWTMHNCRHTYGTAVQQLTGDMLQTQMLMRHESLETTRLYVEPIQAPGIRAMDKLSGNLKPRDGLGRAG